MSTKQIAKTAKQITKRIEAQVYVNKLDRRYHYFHSGSSHKGFKTFGGAVRAAQRRGFNVVTKDDPMVQFLKDDRRTKIVTNMISGELVRIPVNTPARATILPLRPTGQCDVETGGSPPVFRIPTPPELMRQGHNGERR